MASIVTLIIAVAKAVPVLANLLSLIANQWNDYLISRIEDNEETKNARLDFATKQFKGATNDAERMAAFRLLVAIK